MTKEKKFMMFGVILLLISLVGSLGTYAWFTWKSTNNTSITMSVGKLADVIFTSGNDISTSTLAPVYNYTDGEKTTFSINNKDTSGASINYDIKLNITSIASELKSTDLKYVLLKNDTIVQEGDFSAITTGSTVIYSDSISSSGTTNFIFYLYIDGNEENDLNMMNKSLVGTLTVEAAEKESFATYITNLYNNASKTIVTNNSINYEYDTTNSLMKDVGDNIRYYGAEPNNYIYFNCSDYSNQSSSTCETWRIIGVFDGKLKLIRNESIGEMPFDRNDEDTYLTSLSNTNNLLTAGTLKNNGNKTIVTPLAGDKNSCSTAAPGGGGENDYSTSSLQKILNNYYYNSKSYSGDSSYVFTSIGIKNDITRNMISSVTYGLGSIEFDYYADGIYNAERGSLVPSSNSTTWTGKIFILYLSDYSYALKLDTCAYNVVSSYYNCASNNWLHKMFGEKQSWLFDISSVNSENVYIHEANGNISSPSVCVNNAYELFPTLMIDENVVFAKGDGSSTNPYQLQVS